MNNGGLEMEFSNGSILSCTKYFTHTFLNGVGIITKGTLCIYHRKSFKEAKLYNRNQDLKCEDFMQFTYDLES